MGVEDSPYPFIDHQYWYAIPALIGLPPDKPVVCRDLRLAVPVRRASTAVRVGSSTAADADVAPAAIRYVVSTVTVSLLVCWVPRRSDASGSLAFLLCILFSALVPHWLHAVTVSPTPSTCLFSSSRSYGAQLIT